MLDKEEIKNNLFEEFIKVPAFKNLAMDEQALSINRLADVVFILQQIPLNK